MRKKERRRREENRRRESLGKRAFLNVWVVGAWSVEEPEVAGYDDDLGVSRSESALGVPPCPLILRGARPGIFVTRREVLRAAALRLSFRFTEFFFIT